MFFGLSLTLISTNGQQGIEGLWDTGQYNTKIEIIGTNGKIYSSDNEKVTVGKIIVKELKKKGNNYKGKLYLFRRNQWVDAVFDPEGNFLVVNISVGWQSKSLKWKLVENYND